MSATAAFKNHYAQVPVELITDLRKGTALRIVAHLLSLCNLKDPVFWVDQRLVGQKLGIHRDSVGRWIRYLVKNGYLEFLGFTGYGGRKRYRLKLSAEKPKEPKLPNLVETTGSIPTLTATGPRHFERNINQIEETNLKEQTVVSFDKKEFSSNAKIALKQKLKTIGVHKHAIETLVAKYSLEKINAQIEHLQFLINRGELIEKQASWLISAIKKTYQLPRELDKAAKEEDQAAKTLEKATQLARDAKIEHNVGNFEKAKELAIRSLALAENSIAKDLIDKEQQKIVRQQKIEEARRLISAEKLSLIQHQEEQKKLQEMRKLVRWSDMKILDSSLFKTAVEELINERLYAY